MAAGGHLGFYGLFVLFELFVAMKNVLTQFYGTVLCECIDKPKYVK